MHNLNKITTNTLPKSPPPFVPKCQPELYIEEEGNLLICNLYSYTTLPTSPSTFGNLWDSYGPRMRDSDRIL